MTGREIADIEKELEVVCRIDERNRQAVEKSKRPLEEEVFLVSSTARRKGLEKELQHAKLERMHELFRLRIHTASFSPGTIPLRVLAKLAELLNGTLELAAWHVWDIGGDTTTISEDFRHKINLRLAGIQAGSTELVILGDVAPDLSGISALEDGLKNFFDVLSTSNDQLADVINGIGIKATKSIIELMKVFENGKMAAELSWKASNYDYYWDGKTEEIRRVRRLLQDIGEPETGIRHVMGVISELTRRRVQIETDDDEKINARYHHSLSQKVNALHLDDRRKFEIEEKSYPQDTFGIKNAAYRLLDFASMD